MIDLKEKIRSIPDFPKKGILFRDITTLIKDDEAFKEALERMAEPFKGKAIDKVAAIEARGFIFGAPLAYILGAGFVPVRKAGKLPAEKISERCTLEYGEEHLEVHVDAISKGERVLIVDDLLATGGTVLATKRLVEQLGGEVVGFVFLIELRDLNGREALRGYDVYSIIQF
ncbi:MAG: adenine phosphoribosyltransferase [bacterium]|nr:MAG: Adenine phosphoribosyltransferase [bacterium 42_11]MDK2871269.1 adenine phosphoribosyltransferase [bacterium]